MSNKPENCPHCKVSLLADPIPKNLLENYSGTHWKREIAHTVRGHGDRTNFYSCPDCDGRWTYRSDDAKRFNAKLIK